MMGLALPANSCRCTVPLVYAMAPADRARYCGRCGRVLAPAPDMGCDHAPGTLPLPDTDMTIDDALTDDDLLASDVLQVLCRVFDDIEVTMEEWRAWYDPQDWLHGYRALGAFIRQRLARLAAEAGVPLCVESVAARPQPSGGTATAPRPAHFSSMRCS